MENTTTDASEMARARSWLDMAQAKWRLQTMQHRSRYNPKTGEYRQLPTRIRRFLNGTPVGMKSLVLAILKESAPYRSPVFDCETDDLVYRPTNTFIRKDGPEHTTGGKDPTYTIIQDLLLDDGRDDAFGFADESSCSQAGETEYHWDEPSVADCPDGGQGVSYQVTDISRDRETDLFSYRVRKVQALTVHVPEHVVECGARRRVAEEVWDNVYGEPGAFRQDPLRGGGGAVAVPEPCGQPDGTSVKVDVYRNPDCTYRVTVQTATAVTDGDAQFSVYMDQYKRAESLRTANAFAPLPRQGAEYSNGVTTRYTSERNEDGTYNNSTEVETERAVASSTVEHRVTPRGTRTTRVDTNQPAAARGISTEYGSWKSTKTPGGLFTNEYSEFTRARQGRLGLSCTQTLFAETHETRTGAPAMPEDLEETHADAAAYGVVKTVAYDVDDEGAVTLRTRRESEHEVRYSVQRRTWGYLGTTSGYQHRSVTEAAATALYNQQAVGTSVEMRRTNGGLYDVDVQSFLRVKGRALGFDCSKTLFQHVHETVSSADAVGAEAQAAGNGHTYQRTFSVDTATGAVTERNRDTAELNVPESRRTVRVTPRGTTVRTTAANAASAPRDPTKAGSEVDWERTPGGRYNVTTTTTTAATGNVARTCEQDAFLHSDGSTSMAAGAPSGDVLGGSGGHYQERGARLGEDGLWEVTTTDHQEKEVGGELHVVVTSRAKRRTRITRQTAGQGYEPNAAASDAGKELRRTKTRGGLWNVEETTVEAIAGDTEVGCSDDLLLHTRTAGRTARDKQADDVEPTSDMSGVYRARRQRLGDDGLWTVEETTSTEHGVSSHTVEKRATRYGLVTRTTDVQVTDDGGKDEPRARVSDIGKELRVEKTRGGRRNVTKTTVEALTGETGHQCEKTAFLHTHVKTELKKEKDRSEHADDAGQGKYKAESYTLTDLGTWEKRTTENTEEQPTLKVQKYQDAFGTTTVTEEFSHNSNDGGEGGEKYEEEKTVQSIEASMTNGKRYNVRTKEERPAEVDSGWLHFEKETDKGLAVYHDFIVFRNAKQSQVNDWINHIQDIEYSGGDGSYANHPSISISPNKFRLWDGTVALVTTYTPKAWAAGGSTEDDNWETEVDILSVNFVPVASGKLLKLVTKETHRRGGGVGKDKLESLLDGGVVKGSQFAFHPGGQAFTYDLITKVETKGVLVSMPVTDDTKTLWNGDEL